VLTAGLVTGILDDIGNRTVQPQPPIDLLQQQHTAVTGDVATFKSGFNAAALTGWEGKRLLGTFCHGQSLVRFQRKQLNFIELHGLAMPVATEQFQALGRLQKRQAERNVRPPDERLAMITRRAIPSNEPLKLTRKRPGICFVACLDELAKGFSYIVRQ